MKARGGTRGAVLSVNSERTMKRRRRKRTPEELARSEERARRLERMGERKAEERALAQQRRNVAS